MPEKKNMIAEQEKNRPTDHEIREALKTMSRSLSHHLQKGNASGVSALTLGLSALRWTLGEDGGFPAVIEVLSSGQAARRTAAKR